MAKATPKETTINGVSFKRSKSGNLIRTMAVKRGLVMIHRWLPSIQMSGGFL